MGTAKQQKGSLAYYSGLAAEGIVARQYALANPISRWRGKSGEIDIIFADDGGFVFVEVKKAKTLDAAAQRLRPDQIRRICNTALEFVATTALGLAATMRFDLALVDETGRCEVIENAFGDGW